MIRYVCVSCGTGVTDTHGDWTKTHIEYFKCEKCINKELQEAVAALRLKHKETPNAMPKMST